MDQTFMSPKIGTANAIPKTIVSGRPNARSLNGSPFSRISDRRSIVDASMKRTSTSVSSTITRTAVEVMPISIRFKPSGPARMPTLTNTMAAETGSRSDRRENSP